QHYFFLIRCADSRGLSSEVIKWGERCARAGFESSMDPSIAALLDRTLGRHVRAAAYSHHQASHGHKHAGESKATARNARNKGGKRRQDDTHSGTQAATAAPADVIEGKSLLHAYNTQSSSNSASSCVWLHSIRRAPLVRCSALIVCRG